MKQLTEEEIVGAAVSMTVNDHPSNPALKILKVEFMAAPQLIPILATGVRIMLEEMPGTRRLETVGNDEYKSAEARVSEGAALIANATSIDPKSAN